MRLTKESSVVVFLRPGSRAFMDTEVPFPKEWCDEIVKRQTAFEEISGYLTAVHQYQRQGGNWKLIEEVPECLAELSQEQPESEPERKATKATSKSKSRSSSKE